MFRIRRIHDDVLPANRAVLEQIQTMIRAQFPGVREESVAVLPELLRNPLAHSFRTTVFIAERDRAPDIRGFAVVAHAPDLGFSYLDFLSASPRESGRGVGGALYESLRDYCRDLGVVGLFFETLPDDPGEASSRAMLEQNRARMRFYERYGARPMIENAYRTPIDPNESAIDLPHLVFDDLGTGRALRRDEARTIVRAILERKYAWLCPPEYVDRVVMSFEADPVVLRAPRYARRPRPEPAPVPPPLRIPLIVAEHHNIHHVRERGYVEAPVRIPTIRKELDRTGLFETIPVEQFGREPLEEVHDREFLDYLERVCASIAGDRSVYPYVFPIRNAARMPDDLETRVGYYCMDTFTPLHRNAWPAARDAVDCALTGAANIDGGAAKIAYALVRPPGHHAERRTFGGFCYLNAAAVAANWLSKKGRVAMLDLDYHHGNGQQDIFYSRADVLTVSIHGHPRFAYPYFAGFEDEVGEGEGVGANMNIALPEKLDGGEYTVHLARALQRIGEHAPRFLVVCLGLDPGQGDPTGTWSLQADDFERNGRLVGALGLPTLVVQEGGYNTKRLGAYARRFFVGLWQEMHGRSLFNEAGR